MKRNCILVFLALFLLPFHVVAEEEKTFYDYLPDDMRRVLAVEYDGWYVVEGTSISVYENWDAALVFLNKEEKNIAIIMEDWGSGCAIVAVNDEIIPDGVPFNGRWWISTTHWDGSQPFIWYTPENIEQGFYYELRREDERGWIVKSGSFGDPNGSSDRLAFDHANGDIALRVYDEYYTAAVYVSIEVDLSFSGFDPEGVKAFCTEALALRNKPALIPSTMEADALPQGQAVSFEKGQKYPVYSGPGKNYMQLGEQHNAVVSTNDWIQVFGQENGWLLIQYNIADRQNRFGYIQASLPKGVDIPELQFDRKAGVLNCWITDDPLRTGSEINFPNGTECVQLATLGDAWVYIETTDPSQPRYRGFTPADSVDLRESHVGRAIIGVESTPLYASASAENPIGAYYGGVEVGVLQTVKDFSQVRIGDDPAYQEGWVLSADLAMGAVPSDVPFTLSKAVLVPAEDDSSARAYASASENAQRISCDTYPAYSIMGEVGGFVQLSSQRGILYNVLFVPKDWAVPIPQDRSFYSKIAPVVLAEDSPVYIRPEQSAASHVTLYKGTTVTCYPMGDWYLVADSSLVPWFCGEVNTFGYLPAGVCRPTGDGISSLDIGRLEPANQGDNRYLNSSMNASAGGIYGWGTRLLVLGETTSRYLVRTPIGEYGFFKKADVVFTGDKAAQEDYASLFYGTTSLMESIGYSQRPYVVAGQIDKYGPDTEVRLMGCLGDWWSAAIGYQTVFLPTRVLLDPPDAPAYGGIYNAFRTLPLWLTGVTEPPIVFTEDEVWLLLREEDQLVLSHMRMQEREGQWVETERIAGVLGEGFRVLSGFTSDVYASPMEFTISCYVTDSNVQIFNTFVRTNDSWRLHRFRMTEVEYLDAIGEQVLYDRTFLPVSGCLVIQEDGQQYEMVLTEPLALDIEHYSVKELLKICLDEMQV